MVSQKRNINLTKTCLLRPFTNGGWGGIKKFKDKMVSVQRLTPAFPLPFQQTTQVSNARPLALKARGLTTGLL